jgi:hypothetical protein
MSAVGDEEYEVGYGKPPLHTRFQAGVSGNPAGRTVGSRNVNTVVLAAASERVTVNQNGKKHSMTKFEAAATQLVNQAAGGDRHAMKHLVDLMRMAEAQADAQSKGKVSPAQQQENDAAQLAALLVSFQKSIPKDRTDEPN